MAITFSLRARPLPVSGSVPDRDVVEPLVRMGAHDGLKNGGDALGVFAQSAARVPVLRQGDGWIGKGHVAAVRV